MREARGQKAQMGRQVSPTVFSQVPRFRLPGRASIDTSNVFITIVMRNAMGTLLRATSPLMATPGERRSKVTRNAN